MSLSLLNAESTYTILLLTIIIIEYGISIIVIIVIYMLAGIADSLWVPLHRKQLVANLGYCAEVNL